MKKSMLLVSAFLALSPCAPYSQPVPAPVSGDLACGEAGSMPGDTLEAPGGPDREGYLPLFDGTFKGWFQGCGTAHSQASDQGAIFRVGRADGRPAIYSTERDGRIGGVMMTRKRFLHYEIAFQFWPDRGNDGSLFHRTGLHGRCFSTTLEYLPAASLGGAWGEGGFPFRDFRPFAFGSDEGTLSIPGNTGGDLSNWTSITRKLRATSEPGLPCAETGCTQADWRALWDSAGWNDIKVAFYGGVDGAKGEGLINVHMKSWFKKPASDTWVPILQDTTLSESVPAGHIGFMVHGGGRFSGARGTWYRDIRWRELDSHGQPLWKPATSIVRPGTATWVGARVESIPGGLRVDSEGGYAIEVGDARGRVLERFEGRAGNRNHAFSASARGLVILRIRTSQGVYIRKIIRPLE